MSITNKNLTLSMNIILVKLGLQIAIICFSYYIVSAQHSQRVDLYK